MFCPKCKSMMIPKDGKYVCSNPKCDAEKELGEAEYLKTAAKAKETSIIKEDEDAAFLTKTRIICPKCGHTWAYYTLRQMRAADEAESRIYRCCKCNHSWRDDY